MIGVGDLTGLVLLWSEDLLDNSEESFSLFNTDDELSANVDDDDPLGLKKGGMMDVKAMKNMKKNDDAYDVGTQFSKETHIRDEDDEMRKFIETEMSRMKGGTTTTTDDNEGDEEKSEFLSPEDAALMSLPQHLTKSTFKKVELIFSLQNILF